MSMVVCIVAGTAIYMAADSLQYPSGADTVQKVFLLGRDAMVGHSGIGVIPYDGNSGRWDAAEEVGKIASRTPNGTIQEQLAFISKEVLTSLNSSLLKRSTELSKDRPRLAIMLVKRSATGAACAHQTITIVSTRLANAKWQHRARADAPEPLKVPAKKGGNCIWVETPPEPPECPVEGRLPAASTYSAIAAYILSVAEQSGRCRQLIGGLIRVAVADEYGARWMNP